MEFDTARTCAFTGHRPEKLPWRYDERDSRCLRLKSSLEDTVLSLYDSGYRHFISGMAKGCDTYFAETVLRLRDECQGMTLEAAVPCETQPSGWSFEERKRYFYILHQCDRQTIVSREYTPECMLRRNMYMVDSASLLLAVYDGTRGGTMQTVNYARSSGVHIIELPIPV